MVGARHDGNFAAEVIPACARPQNCKRVAQVLEGVRALAFHDELVFGNPVSHKPAVHARGLAHGLVGALAPGQHGRGIRMRIQIPQRRLEPPEQGIRGVSALIHPRAKNNDILDVIGRIGLCVRDNGDFRHRHGKRNDTHDAHCHLKRQPADERPENHEGRGDKQDKRHHVVATQGKTQHRRQRRK